MTRDYEDMYKYEANLGRFRSNIHCLLATKFLLISAHIYLYLHLHYGEIHGSKSI